jgi:tetratricopeptide (TPR) repeat protein
MVPVDGEIGTAIAVGLATSAAVWPRARPVPASALSRALVHAAIALSMVVAVRYTDAAYDYWRFRAGDGVRREELEAAVADYLRANALRPDEEARHAALGDLYLRLGRPGEAAREYRAALRAAPRDERARAGLARATALAASR